MQLAKRGLREKQPRKKRVGRRRECQRNSVYTLNPHPSRFIHNLIKSENHQSPESSSLLSPKKGKPKKKKWGKKIDIK